MLIGVDCDIIITDETTGAQMGLMFVPGVAGVVVYTRWLDNEVNVSATVVARLIGAGELRKPDGAVFDLDRAGVSAAIETMLLSGLLGHKFEIETYGAEVLSGYDLLDVNVSGNAARDEYKLKFGRKWE